MRFAFWGLMVLVFGLNAQSLVAITEIFPRAQTDVPEWFEIFNVSSSPVNINGWRYGTVEDSMVLCNENILIEPGQFLVVVKDKALFALRFPEISRIYKPSVWITLNNYKDTLCLWNDKGLLCETVAYDYTWFTNWTDQSLERVSLQIQGVDKNAWVVSQKPSPGQPNSSMGRLSNECALEIGPIPFTPNNDGKNDFLSIRCSVPASFSVSLSVYGFNGKKYCDVPIAFQQQYLWDGRTSSGTGAQVGPFFVVATFKNGSQTNVIRKKGILWR